MAYTYNPYAPPTRRGYGGLTQQDQAYAAQQGMNPTAGLRAGLADLQAQNAAIAARPAGPSYYQQQMANDNSKAIGELKASQEEMKRTLAKVSEPTPPKASSPPVQPAPALRRPERTYQPPQARARPRYYPREWMYDDW